MKKAADAIPNQKLVEERFKRHWSQQEVASRVGTTAVNVSRWERGLSFPGAYFRYQLCALFERDAEELALVAKVSEESSEPTSSPAAPSLITPIAQLPWNVPYRRNPFFTGREDILTCLHDVLASGKAILTQAYAISGLGGIGKTQTAIEYAYRYRDAYHAVLWARADTQENLLADLVTIADLLHLPDLAQQDQSFVVESVKRWLHDHADWLLVLDNVEDLTVLNDFLPSFHHGHVLLTTRTQITGTLAQRIDLEKMELAEGALFLLRRSKHIGPSTNLEDAAAALYIPAKEIAQLMDGLPLALDQAGAYIEETMCDVSDYLERYQSRRACLLNLRGEVVTDHPASVSVTFSLSIEKVALAAPLAADLLRLCAFLQPDAIPEEILVEGTAELSTVLQLATSNYDSALTFDAAIKELRKFSLLQRNPEAKMFSVHRLVQAVLRDTMDEETQRQWVDRTVRVVNRAFPNGEFTTWQRCQQCLPQVQVCAALIAQWQIISPEAAHLLRQAGRYIYEQASFYAQAEPLLQQSLRISEQAFGPKHPEVAQSLSYLGKICNEQGKYSQAESLFRRVLAIQEQALGCEHPKLAQSLIYLAMISMDQGKYEQTEQLLQRVLLIARPSAGPEANALPADSLQVVQNLNTLAHVYHFQGQYESAESLFRQVLAIREQALQPADPEIADSLSSLGWIYIAQEKYAQAQPFFQRALTIHEQSLELSHPMIGLTLNTLARLYYFQGQYEEAEPLFYHALSIREQALGLDSPCVAETLSNLAELYHAQQRFTQVEYYCQQALDIYKKVWGTEYREHAEVTRVLSTLANLYHPQDR